MDYRHGRLVHGGLDVAELDSLGLAVSDILDFSVSVNPLGPSRGALQAAQSVNLGAYPDPDCVRLRNAIGREVGIEPDRILAGNGSTELIHLIARAFLGSGDTAAVFAPTFGEYAAACHLQGVAPTTLSSDGTGFRWDVPAALDSIAELRPAIVFLCNPNNPTGVYLREKEVQALAEALDGTGLLVLDEAYVSFVDDRWDSTQLLAMHNVVLLRSMTKDHALTGLRLGFMLSSPDVVGRVRRYQYSWSVNALAQAAGIAAIADREHVERGREAWQGIPDGHCSIPWCGVHPARRQLPDAASAPCRRAATCAPQGTRDVCTRLRLLRASGVHQDRSEDHGRQPQVVGSTETGPNEVRRASDLRRCRCPSS